MPLCNYNLLRICALTCTGGVSADVNFIASPPSMVAAGSVVAAVQGLYLKSQDPSLSSENLTNFLSQVIRSDPVCKDSQGYSQLSGKNQHCRGCWQYMVLTQSGLCAYRIVCGHVRSRSSPC